MADVTSIISYNSIAERRLTFDIDDLDNTDVVLRTDDGTDLYVHRLILEVASDIWRTELRKPQSASALDQDGRRIVELHHTSSKYLRIALRICYQATTEIANIDDALEVLHLAGELKIQHVRQHVVKWLQIDIFSDPLYKWAWACHPWRRYQRVAALAAKAWKEITFCRSTEGLPVAETWIDNLDALLYYRLLAYGKDAGQPVPEFFAPPAPDPDVPRLELADPFAPKKIPTWDTLVIASDGVIFHIDSRILQAPKLWEEKKELTADVKYCLKLELDSQATWLLLSLCLPLSDVAIGKRAKKAPAVAVYRMMKAAQQYLLGDSVKKHRSPFEKYKPVCLYLFAVQTDRWPLARSAAIAWVKTLPERAKPEELALPFSGICEGALQDTYTRHHRMLCKFRDAYIHEELRPRDSTAVQELMDRLNFCVGEAGPTITNLQ